LSACKTAIRIVAREILGVGFKSTSRVHHVDDHLEIDMVCHIPTPRAANNGVKAGHQRSGVLCGIIVWIAGAQKV
jgi:hypothetical protein